MNAVVRVAQAADAAAACRILRRAISECCTEDHRNDRAILDAWLGNKTPENVASWFACTAHYSVVAQCGDTLAGVAILSRQGRILLFYIEPALRYTGTGKALLQALETQGREWGLRSMQVASTYTASAFYLRNGFTETGRTRSAYGAEALALVKQLPGGSPCGCGR
ncbi:MAG TPA: GNAT family N-acetyltransferase [Noviherbaspirillum sp.]|uniref:GNAT family N-acetyltransferase n=1 Tax=Noviherbaspirillum sp. TaxID=1926288 RepID=UPI002D347CDB|nr:GNAT family N-acetyltransferase [Noviherbaspirillum sp.]HYD97727.1 GNAT family N-acetyltransferase [Noviherbaspirillum sp.]